MPKLDFNVALLSQDGTPQMRTKVDKNKVKKMPDGSMQAEPVLDAEGYVVQEQATLRQYLSAILDNIYIGEEGLTQEERLARGKLSRKVADGSGSSLKNYSLEELQLLRHCMAKSQTAPSICAQVEELIAGGQYTKEEKPSANENAAQA